MWEPQPSLDFTSADGSLHFEQRIERWSDEDHNVTYGRRLIVRDLGAQAVILDTREWPVVEAIDREDGAVDIRLSLFLRGSDVFFRLDPGSRTFRDVGMTGPMRPLAELQTASDAAKAETEAFTGWVYDSYGRRYISRDGRMRVEVYRTEPDRAPATSRTEVFDTESGEQVTDLDRPGWSSWLRPYREQDDAFGILSVTDNENFAWLNFVLEPATVSFRADQDHRASKPIAELSATVQTRLQVEAAKRAAQAVTPPGSIDRILTLLAGIALGAFAGFIGFGIYSEMKKREPAPPLAQVPEMTPLYPPGQSR